MSKNLDTKIRKLKELWAESSPGSPFVAPLDSLPLLGQSCTNRKVGTRSDVTMRLWIFLTLVVRGQAPPNLFQNREQAVATACGAQERQSVITRATDKVQVMGAVGAMQATGHDKQNGTGSIATRPCKKRKDGAPSVPEWEGKKPRVGHPPSPNAFSRSTH